MSGLPRHGLPRPPASSPGSGRPSASRRRTIAGLERCEDRTLMATLFGVTAAREFVRFDDATPGTIVSSMPITGLSIGETLVGIDFRPKDGRLYGVGSLNGLYTIEPRTGCASTL